MDYMFFKAFEAQQALLDAILTNQGKIMASIQDLQATLDTVKQETGDYIAQRDAIDVTLNATIADLTAQLATGAANAATVQAGIDAAFVTAEEAKRALAPPTGVVVPA